MSVNVARIYEQTIRPGDPYCRICLRTREETTLVTAKHIVQFTNSVKLKIFDGKRKDTVCYYCEAIAKTALKLFSACVNAVSVKSVCQPLKHMKPDDPVPEWIRKTIIGCNSHLKEYRAQTSLTHTEVLTVDSTGIEWPSSNKGLKNSTRIIAPSIPKEVDTSDYPTVVLDDDDEVVATGPADTQAPKLVSIDELLSTDTGTSPFVASILPNTNQIISRHEDQNFIVHPTINTNGVVVVPSLGCEIKDGRLIYNRNLFQPLPIIDCTDNKSGESLVRKVYQGKGPNGPVQMNNQLNTIQQRESSFLVTSCSGNSKNKANQLSTMQNTETVEVHSNLNKLLIGNGDNNTNKFPIVKVTEEILKTVDIESILNKKLVNLLPDSDNKRSSIEPQKNGSKKARKESQSYIVDFDMVNSLAMNSTDSDPIAVISNVVSTKDSEVINISDDVEEIVDVQRKGAGPVEKVGKIDWEDKIPMDVISFVDATDPNTSEFILPEPTTPLNRPHEKQNVNKSIQAGVNPIFTIDLS